MDLRLAKKGALTGTGLVLTRHPRRYTARHTGGRQRGRRRAGGWVGGRAREPCSSLCGHARAWKSGTPCGERSSDHSRLPTIQLLFRDLVGVDHAVEGGAQALAAAQPKAAAPSRQPVPDVTWHGGRRGRG